MEQFTPSTAHAEPRHAWPAPDTIDGIHEEILFYRAVEAYRFFYPTVSMESVFNGSREAGVDDGKGIMLMAAGPRHLIFTANSDTPYACAVLDLKALGPTVIELPAGPYVALADDHNHRWIADMGITGPDGGKGGKHLLLPPGFTRAVPNGHFVGRSPTHKVMLGIRVIPQGGDVAGAMAGLRRVLVYPYGKPAEALPFIDVTDRQIDLTPLRWEESLDYWQHLHEVLWQEPPVDELRPMYGLLAPLGLEKERPFSPSTSQRRILEAAARVALDQMRVEAFASRKLEHLVWPDRRWEWVSPNLDNGNFETRSYLDLEARNRWFFQAIGASPAMVRRQAGGGSLYFMVARDRAGAYLDGGRSYRVQIPQPVPAKLFWSVTAYDAKTRSQVRAAQDKAVLGSLQVDFQRNADGSVDLHFGPTAPPERERQWIQTNHGTGVFLYFRIYGPEPAALDGSWKPGELIPSDQ